MKRTTLDSLKAIGAEALESSDLARNSDFATADDEAYHRGVAATVEAYEAYLAGFDPSKEKEFPLSDAIEAAERDLHGWDGVPPFYIESVSGQLREVGDKVFAAERDWLTHSSDLPVEQVAIKEAPKDRGPAVVPFKVVPGDVNFDVFEQSEIWVDRHGTAMWLTDMSHRHLTGVLRFIEKRAVLIHRVAQRNEITSFFSMTHHDEDDLYESPRDVTADQWMRTRPLYRAITALLNP